MPVSPAVAASNAAFDQRLAQFADRFGLTITNSPSERGLWFGRLDKQLDIMAAIESIDDRLKALEGR